MKIAYRDHRPDIGNGVELAPGSAVIGRTRAGDRLALRGLATIRADGEHVQVGSDVFFAERATVHIADALIGTAIGDRVTVGRYAVVHACTLGEGVVVADAAVVMDGASIDAWSLIAPGSLVPPRKQLQGGWLYQGHPAVPVRQIERDEVASVAAAIRSGRASSLGSWNDLPPLDMAPWRAVGGEERLLASGGRTPRVGRAYVAPTAIVAGDVDIADEASVWFGCVLSAGDARIRLGPRTNVQDNTLLTTDAKRGDLIVGASVTFGHNVRMGSGVIEDEALIGIGSKVGDGVVVERGGCIGAGAWVEPGTVVRAGWIWAGRPARAFRELRPAEREEFARGCTVYVGYCADYLAGASRL